MDLFDTPITVTVPGEALLAVIAATLIVSNQSMASGDVGVAISMLDAADALAAGGGFTLADVSDAVSRRADRERVAARDDFDPGFD